MRAAIFAGIGATLGLAGLVKPEAIRPFFAALNGIARPIGLVMTRVILGVAYFGLFTPVALVFRMMGRDPLERKRHADVPTYWHRRTRPNEPRRYFRQV